MPNEETIGWGADCVFVEKQVKLTMLDLIIPKLLREYVDTDDPARRAEIVQVLQDYGAFPKIFDLCANALSLEVESENAHRNGLSNESSREPLVREV